jgi:hypothetical protein
MKRMIPTISAMTAGLKPVDSIILAAIWSAVHDAKGSLSVAGVWKRKMVKLQDREIERLRQLQWTLHRLAKPFVDLKVDILSRVIPTMRIYADGKTETIYPPEAVEMLAQVDEMYQREVARVIKNDFRDFEDAFLLQLVAPQAS